MDLGLTYRALANGRVDLIAGDSTSGLIPSYDAVPVFNAASLERHPELVQVLENLAGRISAVTMQQLNAAVDLDQQSPELVLRRWRQDH
jgi:osmoprotectant transport system permease protein